MKFLFFNLYSFKLIFFISRNSSELRVRFYIFLKKILFLVLHKYKNVFNICRDRKVFCCNSILVITPKNCHVFRGWNGLSHQVVFESYIFCMHGAYNLEREVDDHNHLIGLFNAYLSDLIWD